MKATNYQKQQLKMFNLEFDSNMSFTEAKNKIEAAEKKDEKQRAYNRKSNGNLEGTGFFDRWTEDLPKAKRKAKQSKQ